MATPAPTHLIIVCCHGIWLGGESKGVDENEWLLAPFQKGDTPAFIDHLKEGLKLHANPDEESLLILSGGPTRAETPLSEAESYLNLALANDFYGFLPPGPSSAPGRGVVLERRALDSHHNLLFSLTKFFAVTAAAAAATASATTTTAGGGGGGGGNGNGSGSGSGGGRWPRRVTVVSHEFKRARFLEVHRAALAWPQARLAFVGVDPPYMRRGAGAADAGAARRAESVRRGERERGLQPWRESSGGAGWSPVLRAKRRARNCWRVSQALFEADDEDGRERLRRSAGMLLVVAHGEEGEQLVDVERIIW